MLSRKTTVYPHTVAFLLAKFIDCEKNVAYLGANLTEYQFVERCATVFPLLSKAEMKGITLCRALRFRVYAVLSVCFNIVKEHHKISS